MAKYPYLTRSGPRGVLCFRRGVPARLRPIVGRREILVSLRTTDLAQGLPACRKVAAEAEATLARADETLQAAARPHQNPTLVALAPPSLLSALDSARRNLEVERERLEQGWRAEEHAFRLSRRARQAAANMSEASRGAWPIQLAHGNAGPARASGESLDQSLETAVRERLQRRLFHLHALRLVQDCRALGLSIPSQVEQVSPRHPATLEAERRAVAAMLREGKELHEEKAHEVAAYSTGSHARSHAIILEGNGPVLSEASKEWMRAHEEIWTEERHSLCASVLADFVAVAGDRPIGSYRKSDGRLFVDLLCRLPANIEKRRPALGVRTRDLVELAAAAEAKGIRPQDPVTINKKVGLLDQAFRWLRSRYDECAPSPVAGMKVPSRRSAKDQKDVFPVEELNDIFWSPPFTGCRSQLHWTIAGSVVLRRSAMFWVLLIALFTGMRSGEILQLRKQHVREHEGVHYFALTSELRLKNPSSVRSVPVHQELIRCGFLSFVAACEDRLFPDAVQHASGRWSDAFGKTFARLLRSLQIKSQGRTLHSLRHNFASAAEASGIEYATRERFLGHVLPGQGGRYGQSYAGEQRDMQLLMLRNNELQKLTFPGLRLDHLHLRSK